MNGISTDNLAAISQLSSGLYSSAGSSASGGTFASMLAQQLKESGNAQDGTVSTADIEKEMILNMCLMMCSGKMSSGPLMASMLASLSQNPGGESNSSTGNTIVDSALSRLGDPYSKTYRGTGNYVDCSSLAQWAYKQAGISIPGTAAAQAKYCYENGYTISKDQLQPGDLIFWENTGADNKRWHDIHHVAIYAGNGKIVEAKTSTKGVVLDDIWEGGHWKIVMYARPPANGASS